MGRIFKRSGCKRHHVEFLDTAGITRRVLGFTDKAASVELSRMLDRVVAIRQSGGILAGDMLMWLETLKPAIRDNLAKWNVIDPQRAAAGKEIMVHVEEWATVLEAKGDCAGYVKASLSRMRRLVAGCNWTLLSDVTAASAQRWLAEQRKAGMSIATSNSFTQSMKGFFNWMIAERRLPENPLAHVKAMNARTDRRRVRRALTTDEIGRLLSATEAAPSHHSMTGRERALLYRLALETGLRWSELRSLRKSSLNFDADPATVTVQAEDEKAGRGETLPLRAELAADLKVHLALHMPGARVFNMWAGKGGAMLERDLKAAGIPKKDEDGDTVDFHSLRHTFGTLLAANGVHPKVAQDLMRHSTITMTMSIYTHTTLDNRMGALNKLPDIKAIRPKANTGNTAIMA